MIRVKTDKIKAIADKISVGVEDDRAAPITELLEFELFNKNLTLKTTNKEYFLTAFIEDVSDNDSYFHVCIIADVFLQLVSKTTTDYITLEIVDTGLKFIGNGEYILPMTLDGDEAKKLPVIDFKDQNNNFKISSTILKSLISFNSRGLAKNIVINNILKYYYIDNEGALTYADSGCINNFTLEKPFKALFNERLVQLFKIFENEEVNIQTCNYDIGTDNEGKVMLQNRIQFTTRDITLTAILPDTDLTEKYPAFAIRQLTSNSYPFSCIISKSKFLKALERMSILDKRTSDNKVELKKIGKLDFKTDRLEIRDVKGINYDIVEYESKEIGNEFEVYIDLTDLTKHANISISENITLRYGNEDAVMMERQNYMQIIPAMEDPTANL